MMTGEETKRAVRHITLLLFAIMLIMAAALGVASYFELRDTYLRFYDEKAQEQVRMLAEQTDWERFEHYAETGEHDAYSAELTHLYDTVKENSFTDAYLYIFAPADDHFTYLYEATAPGDDPDYICQWGERFDYTDFEYKYLVPDIKAGTARSEIVLMSTDEYGAGLETWAPVFDDSGALRAMVEMDYILPSFQHDLNTRVARIILLFVILVAITYCVMRWAVKNALEKIAYAGGESAQGVLKATPETVKSAMWADVENNSTIQQ